MRFIGNVGNRIVNLIADVSSCGAHGNETVIVSGENFVFPDVNSDKQPRKSFRRRNMFVCSISADR